MTIESIVPWRDDCLLPEESLYSAISKIAWFQAMPPARYMSEILRRSQIQIFIIGPTERWLSRLREHPMLPMAYGRESPEWITALAEKEELETPLEWRSRALHVCDECLDEGVHLKIHQDKAVRSCPVHMVPLRSSCRHCLRDLPLWYAARTEAFCCPHCGTPLSLVDAWGSPRSRKQRREIRAGTQQVMRSVVNVRGFVGPDVDAVLKPMEWKSPLAMVNLRLDCISATVKAHPALRRLHLPKVELKAEEIKPRGIFASAPKLLEEFDLESFQLATSLVVTWFLCSKGRAHEQCLDSPLRMFGESFGLDTQRPEDILRCCPVAAGFWLWRLSNCRQIELRLRSKSTLGGLMMDRPRLLVLYKLLKSHLQYYLHVSQHMMHLDLRHLADFVRLAALRRLERTPATDFYFREVENFSASLVRFDMKWRWMDTPCDGYASYASRLRRQVQDAETLAGEPRPPLKYPVDVDPPLIHGRLPFTPMRLEGFLRR